MSFWNNILKTIGLGVASAGSAGSPPPESESLADAVLSARESAYREHFGPLPDDIMKMADLIGRWPGGGIYQIRRDTPDGSYWITLSSGLSNPDIPAAESDTNIEHDEQGRPRHIHTTLHGSGHTLPATGYGYEILVITPERADWPLILLQWAIHAEFRHGIGLLERVEQYQGVTVSDIPIDDNGNSVNLLIHKAQAPLPESLHLPNGHIPLLVMTTISHDEMNWSLQEGRQALLDALLASPTRQMSVLDRPSVVE